MVKMSDFKTANGINFEAYHAAQISSGEICYHCKKNFILFSNGSPAKCSSCTQLGSSEELHHDSIIRCPKCSCEMSAEDTIDYMCFDEEQEIFCGCCDHRFFVGVRIQYTYISPPLDTDAHES